MSNNTTDNSEHIILLVEDNEDDIALTLRAFKKCNLTNKITVARDGHEAINYLFGKEQYAERDINLKPELVLMDINMPKVSGLEVLEIMRKDNLTRVIPVVMLTTSIQDEDVIDSYKMGANSYIRKPVDYNQFFLTIQQLNLYWTVLNKRPYG